MSARRATSAETDVPLHFDAVLDDERDAGWPEQGKAVGLALSGGGIRSATFNLGVIQALAEKKRLRKFDYLSTISGGGYIGSWLSLFIKRYAGGDIARAETEICKRDGTLEHPAIRFLRSYSNYLTPRVGLSKDTLVAAATYLRNLFLNLIILIALTGGVLILPRIAAQVGKVLVNWDRFSVWHYPMMAAVLLPPTFAIAMGLFYKPGTVVRRPWFMGSRWLVVLVDVPVVTAGFLATCFYIRSAMHGVPGTRLWTTVFVYVALWVVGVGLAGLYPSKERYRFTRVGRSLDKAKWPAAFLLFAVLAGTAGAAFMMSIGKAILALPDAHRYWAAVTFGPPAVITAFVLMVVVHIGLMGRLFHESDRELWSVYGARLIVRAVMWAVIFTIAFYGSVLLKWTHETIVGMGGFVWIATTLFGLLAGKSEKTRTQETKPWVEVLTRLAPYVFVLGLLLLLSWGLDRALNWGHDLPVGTSSAAPPVEETQRAAPGIFLRAKPSAGAPLVTVRSIETPSLWDEFLGIAKKEYQRIAQWFTPWWALAAMAAAAIIAALLVAWRVNINLFSLHHFYCNRLTRCYLGATNQNRCPHPLTGFDPNDDVPLSDLAKQKPLHIVGTAINLNRGRQLAWQNRRAASFAFTPRHAGYEPASHQVTGGFRPTAEYGKDTDNMPIQLGTAVAISGAAASPNMGYHTSPAVAFLLTVFNVRLGHWCGDPVHPAAWRNRDPMLSLRYWIAELTGSADIDYPFVSLSDGGHFENLGIYELVRRRCAVILASDASADLKYAFDDLAEAMRKCYTDFGVEFRFKPETRTDDIRPQPDDKVSEEWVGKRHYAVAEIKYPDPTPPGTLIYWKASLTAALPADITNYRRMHKDFPHETTADQFFDESQFESYRHLGYEVAMRSLEAMNGSNQLPDALK